MRLSDKMKAAQCIRTSRRRFRGVRWKRSAGDIALFDSYIPHRSHPNTSDRPHDAMYITYNRLSEGSHREDYFADNG